MFRSSFVYGSKDVTSISFSNELRLTVKIKEPLSFSASLQKSDLKH